MGRDGAAKAVPSRPFLGARPKEHEGVRIGRFRIPFSASGAQGLLQFPKTCPVPRRKSESAMSSRLPIPKRDALMAGLVFGLGLALYGRTAVPGLLPGDSGELQTLAVWPGYTHPTGYPVMLALLHPFVRLLPGEAAYEANLFSGVMAALALVALYAAARALTRFPCLALAGAVIVALAPTFWSQAVLAEVYTPGAAFFLTVTALLLHWERHPSRRGLLFLAGMVGGLGLGVHMSVALLAPAALVLMLLRAPRDRRAWVAGGAGALLGLGLTLALFLWLEWRASPADYFRQVVLPSVSAWGLTPQDVDTWWEKVRFLWTAPQFRPYMARWEALPRNARIYAAHLPRELGLLPLLAALVAAGGLARSRKPPFLFLAMALALQWLFTFTYAIWDLYVFFLPGYLLLTLFAVAGTDVLARTLQGFLPEAKGPRWARREGAGTALLLALVWMLAAVMRVPPSWREAVVQGRTPDFPFEEYPTYDPHLLLRAEGTVQRLPRGALVLTDWGDMWPYTYAAYVRLQRYDLLFVETQPQDDQDHPAASLLAYVQREASRRPVLVSQRSRFWQEAGFRQVPVKMGFARFYLLRRP